ncbi:Frataxin [Morchella conica CCBAS932]|uniref:ferroxidase n=2 Tax=Morchella sect. Distantes TaxID=1051054 RepID=A0A3N4KRA7_9PEZI|nr:Frataxin [Morchella conica CCBAS932]
MLRQQPRIIANPSQWFIVPARAPGIVAAKRAFSQTQAVAYNKGGFSLEDFHKVSEGTLEGILESVEAIAEKRTDVDVEYSAGVLTITLPQGTYVINKQPPNRQIWISSPITGPNRFDWDPINYKWISTRDGSTLGGVLKKEIGIEFSISMPLGYL